MKERDMKDFVSEY